MDEMLLDEIEVGGLNKPREIFLVPFSSGCISEVFRFLTRMMVSTGRMVGDVIVVVVAEQIDSGVE